jgi:hypothetical protein
MVNGWLSFMKNVTKAHTSKEVVVTGIKHGRDATLIKDKSPKNLEIPTKAFRSTPSKQRLHIYYHYEYYICVFIHDESLIIKHPITTYDHPCTVIFPFKFIFWSEFVNLDCINPADE